MKTLTRLGSAVLITVLLSMGALGCNTVRGVGKDIERSGRAVECVADHAERHMCRDRHKATCHHHKGYRGHHQGCCYHHKGCGPHDKDKHEATQESK